VTIARNRRLRNARLLAHDLVCMSGCDGREDHARRTQHQLARQLLDADDPTLRRLIHDLLHVYCADPDAHATAITDGQVARWRSVLDLPTEPTVPAVIALLDPPDTITPNPEYL
jgi:hypothetical protein